MVQKVIKMNVIQLKKKLLEIKNNKLNFISRGDDSGTHKKEKELWKLININANRDTNWYPV